MRDKPYYLSHWYGVWYGLQGELERKLMNRRSMEDDGLPASPVGTPTTADILSQPHYSVSDMCATPWLTCGPPLADTCQQVISAEHMVPNPSLMSSSFVVRVYLTYWPVYWCTWSAGLSTDGTVTLTGTSYCDTDCDIWLVPLQRRSSPRIETDSDGSLLSIGSSENEEVSAIPSSLSLS